MTTLANDVRPVSAWGSILLLHSESLTTEYLAVRSVCLLVSVASSHSGQLAARSISSLTVAVIWYGGHFVLFVRRRHCWESGGLW